MRQRRIHSAFILSEMCKIGKGFATCLWFAIDIAIVVFLWFALVFVTVIVFVIVARNVHLQRSATDVLTKCWRGVCGLM